MKIKFRKKFLIELSKVPNASRREIEEFVFEKFPANPSLQHWRNIISLKHDPSLFKIPFNEYRLGLKRTERELIFERIRHRNDIYRIHT
jgi:mRNA-degrading endonuclease RelE of RelBE toxin-antitoxin system